MNRTPQEQNSADSKVLYMALDIGNETWVAAFAMDLRSKPRVRAIKATADKDKRGVLIDEIASARDLFGAQALPVVSCYEAGAEGFWLHHWLGTQGVQNTVVHPNSVSQGRTGKQPKTDRIDAQALLGHLVRDHRGESCEPLRSVEIPSFEADDQRTFTRSLDELHKQETGLHNRLQSLLRAQGIEEVYHSELKANLGGLVTGAGRAIGPYLRLELERLCDDLATTQARIAKWENERLRMVTKPDAPLERKAAMLSNLRGIGPVAATVLVFELFGWRKFKNGKKVGSYLGLAPTPYSSGSMNRDQGISKAGPSHVRALMIQLAWAWLRYQPDSKLTLWYNEHVGAGGKRAKRPAIVAVARKLAVLLWKYAEFGEIPEGAQEKTLPQRLSMRAVKLKSRRVPTRQSSATTKTA